MTLKIRTILLGGLLITTTLQARDTPYAFGTLGLGVSNQNHHLTIINPNSDDIVRNAALSKPGFAGGLFAGAAMNIEKRWHLGAFLNIQGDSFNKTFQVGQFVNPNLVWETVGMKQKSLPWGGGTQLGFNYDKALVYAHFGVMSRSYKITFDSNNNLGQTSNALTKNQRFTAFTSGLGCEYAVQPLFSIGFRGAVEFAPAKKLTAPTTARIHAGTTLKVMPRIFTALLTATYKMNF